MNWIAKRKKEIKERKHKIGNWIEKNLLIVSILTPIILIGIRFILLHCFLECYNSLRDGIGLNFYQIILISGALIGLLWTNKRYKQGKESLEQGQEIAFKNKMNTQYLEVIKAVSDENQKNTPIVANLINAIQASINTFYNAKEDKKNLEEKINKIRKETLNFWGMNLAGANLAKADLRGADLRGVDLSGADLRCTDLRWADLRWADLRKVVGLSWAHLSGADLSEAHLSEVDLSEDHLSEDHLREADLRKMDLSEAHLSKVDLSGANLIGTIFAIDSLNKLSPDQLANAKNVAEIKIHIYSEKKDYSLKKFIEMDPSNRIIDGKYLNNDMFEYLVEQYKLPLPIPKPPPTLR